LIFRCSGEQRNLDLPLPVKATESIKSVGYMWPSVRPLVPVS
jgi:hypothetical protein